MKHFLPVIFLSSLLVYSFPAAAGTPAANLAPGWTIRLSGALQFNGGDWRNWYTWIPPGPSPVGSLSATNGIQGISPGLDASLDYRISNRFVLGVAAGFMPSCITPK